VAIAGGGFHSLALKGDGTVVAWGESGSGETNVPPDLTNVIGIAAGGGISLALKADHTLAAWGENDYGQTTVPIGLSNVVTMTAGEFHALALKSDETVIAWGRNDQGQTNVPSSLSNVVSIAGGSKHSLAITADGQIIAWGGNRYHQLDVPPSLANVLAIGAGSGDCSLALLAEDPGVRPSLLPLHRAGQVSQLDVLGESHRGYMLQTSDDLRSWSNSVAFTNFSGCVHLNVSDGAPVKFYRAKSLP
jgi:alpha-tubulin suppressor-like RCC1 family protein